MTAFTRDPDLRTAATGLDAHSTGHSERSRYRAVDPGQFAGTRAPSTALHPW